MMYHGFDFVPLVLLSLDFDSISVFRFGSISDVPIIADNRLSLDYC